MLIPLSILAGYIAIVIFACIVMKRVTKNDNVPAKFDNENSYS